MLGLLPSGASVREMRRHPVGAVTGRESCDAVSTGTAVISSRPMTAPTDQQNAALDHYWHQVKTKNI
jgi:hypothetical protein